MEHIFSYGSNIQEIPIIRENLAEIAKAWSIPESELRQIGVIVEELFSNIVRFAYADKEYHEVEISLRKNDQLITIGIIDDGIPFNPLNYQTEPTFDPVSSETGGMGLTLIRTFSDSIVYKRTGKKNLLEITKKIKSQP